MLRSEIKALRDECRNCQTHFASGTAFVPISEANGAADAYGVIADRLTTILDADPVAKLEAMGYTVSLHAPCAWRDEDGGADSSIVLVAVGVEDECETLPEGAHPDAIHDAAARLLARITEAP